MERPGHISCFTPAVPSALDHQASHQRGGEQLTSEELKQPCDPPEPCVCDPTRQLGSGPSDDKLGGVRVLEREGDRYQTSCCPVARTGAETQRCSFLLILCIRWGDRHLCIRWGDRQSGGRPMAEWRE